MFSYLSNPLSLNVLGTKKKHFYMIVTIGQVLDHCDGSKKNLKNVLSVAPNIVYLLWSICLRAADDIITIIF